MSETGDREERPKYSAGDPLLGCKSAIDAAKKWKFKTVYQERQADFRSSLESALQLRIRRRSSTSEEVRADDSWRRSGSPPATGDAPERCVFLKAFRRDFSYTECSRFIPSKPVRNGIQGTVVLRAVISKDGWIDHLTLISGPKELAPAAIGAVQQWRYKPYLLMGNPVEVDTEILVNFKLSY